MPTKLPDLKRQFSTLEAVFVYLACFGLLYIVSHLLFLTLPEWLQAEIWVFFKTPVQGVVYIVGSLLIPLFISSKKGLLKNNKYVVLSFLASGLTLFLGLWAGLIPVAYLTTKPPYKD